MSYPDSIVKWMKAKEKACYCCGYLFKPWDYRALHSMLGLHLVLAEADNPPRYVYVATDPPEKYGYMKGAILEVSEYGLGFRYEGDAVVLCHNCHVAVGNLALELCRERIPGFSGNTPTPKILLEATKTYRIRWANALIPYLA